MNALHLEDVASPWCETIAERRKWRALAWAVSTRLRHDKTLLLEGCSYDTPT